jgi:hypothetical protein
MDQRMEIDPEPPELQPQPAQRATEVVAQRTGLLSAAGWALHAAAVLASLGAVVYAVGAITLWLRLWKSAWPADIAIEHEQRSALIALGLRGTLVIVLPFIVLVGLLLVARPTLHGVLSRAQREGLAWLVLIVLAIGLVIGLSFVSWRAFGIAIALTALILASHWYVRVADPSPAALAGLSTVCLLAAIAAAVAFQLGGIVHVQAVRLSQVPAKLTQRSPRPDLLARAPFPYFGESDAFIYVGSIRSIVETSPGFFHFNFCNESRDIVEVRRDKVSLVFLSDPDNLYSDREAPGFKVWHWLFGSPGHKPPHLTQEMQHQCDRVSSG